MRVSEIEVTSTADSCELRGYVSSDRDPDHDDWFEPFALWYRFPPWCAPFLSVDNGDPFLSALLVPAMRTGEDLDISAPVSPRLLGALADIQNIYACFDRDATRVAVEALPRTIATSAGEPASAGLYFSLGVDSFYSLLKNQRDHPNDAQSVTHLIALHGWDVMYDDWDDRFFPPILGNLQRVADATGATLVPVTTNVRRECGRLASWVMLHGAALASVALALGGCFHHALIAGSTTYDKLFPWGSHPVLDPLWSTENLRFVHDGCEMDIIDKTASIAEWPLAMETLRPCAGYGQGYNCGRCLKCVRTMLDLYRVDALEQSATLPHTIAPEVVRGALRGRHGPAHILNYQRRYDELRRKGAPPELLAVLAEHVATLTGKPPQPLPARRQFVDAAMRLVGRGRLE
jgi:hypothetical protein